MRKFIVLAAGVLMLSVTAVAGPNGGGGVAPKVAGPLLPNTGHTMCTATIDGATGKASSGMNVNKILTGPVVGFPGNYEVIFRYPCVNITAKRGWMRFVQVDTHTFGTASKVSCTTADRSTNRNGVFVNCFNPMTGLDAIPTAFSIIVTR